MYIQCGGCVGEIHQTGLHLCVCLLCSSSSELEGYKGLQSICEEVIHLPPSFVLYPPSFSPLIKLIELKTLLRVMPLY